MRDLWEVLRIICYIWTALSAAYVLLFLAVVGVVAFYGIPEPAEQGRGAAPWPLRPLRLWLQRRRGGQS